MITKKDVQKLAAMAELEYMDKAFYFIDAAGKVVRIGPTSMETREAYFWIQGFLAQRFETRRKIDRYNDRASQRVTYFDMGVTV